MACSAPSQSVKKRRLTQTRCRGSASCRLWQRGMGPGERQGRTHRKKRRRVDRQNDVMMYTHMRRSVPPIRTGPIANTYQDLQGWRGRRRGCRCGQQEIRYSDEIRRLRGTWRWGVNWRCSRWTCPPMRRNVVREVWAGEESFGQLRGWILHGTGEAGAFFWGQRSPNLICRITFYSF